MRQIFEDLREDDKRTKHNFRKSNRVNETKYKIEDVHYVMMYHLHI